MTEEKRTDKEAEEDVLNHFHVAFDETIRSVTLKYRGKVIKRIGKGE